MNFLRGLALLFGLFTSISVGSVSFLLILASLASEDQRVYNSCVIKHKSADYCRLIVSGR